MNLLPIQLFSLFSLVPVLLVHAMALLVCAARWSKSPNRHAMVAGVALYGIVVQGGWYLVSPFLSTTLFHTLTGGPNPLPPIVPIVLMQLIGAALSMLGLIGIGAVALLTAEPER